MLTIEPSGGASPGVGCRFAGLGTLLTVMVLAGCRGEPPESFTRVAIQGTVTLDGDRLDDALIRFVPTGQTAGPKSVYSIRQGEFSASARRGPPLGTHRVEIELTDPGELAHDDEQILEQLNQQPRQRIAPPGLPPIYHAQSELTAELAEPGGGQPQQLEFSLSSNPP